jgi:hypothetical protein
MILRSALATFLVVSALSPGSAYGGGEFMITEQGTVENLRQH